MARVHASRALLLLLASVSAALAFGPPAGFGPPSGSGSDPFGDPFGGPGSGDGFPGFLGFDVGRATYIRTIHGIVGAATFVGIYPVGAILLRLLPGRAALVLHGLIQMVGYLAMIATVGLGIYLMVLVNIRGTSLFEIGAVSFHPIIGIVVLIGLALQPLWGCLHHRAYRRYGGRGGWSYLHVYAGRIMITLGIINGGLGLFVAGADDKFKIAYGVCAAVMWLLWFALGMRAESRRGRDAARAENKLYAKEGPPVAGGPIRR